MSKITGKLAHDIEAGDIIICRDGGARAVYCVGHFRDEVRVVFSNHETEVYDHYDEIDFA